MDRTTYTDPSGFDPSTVSTAADQLRIFEEAMRFPVRQIVSMPSVTLPVAGTLTNYNPLIADGFAGKTGSDSAAGGCLAFLTDRDRRRAPAHRDRRGDGAARAMAAADVGAPRRRRQRRPLQLLAHRSAGSELMSTANDRPAGETHE